MSTIAAPSPIAPGSPELVALLDEIAAGAAGRERDARPPHDVIDRVRGTLFGNAASEVGGSRPVGEFVFETLLTASGDGYRLDGTKYYSTGSLFSDRVAVFFSTEDGRLGSAIVPVDRLGVTLEDDSARDDAAALVRGRERTYTHAAADSAPADPQLQQVVGQIASVGGASATKQAHNLDRHWRNARTLASHNPTLYKARAIGDHTINGVPLPPNGFF